jgi:hypothetical protein
MLPSSGEGRDTLTLLGPLERANPIYCTGGLSPHLKTATDPISETLCFLVFRMRTTHKVHKPSDSKLNGISTFFPVSIILTNFTYFDKLKVAL